MLLMCYPNHSLNQYKILNLNLNNFRVLTQTFKSREACGPWGPQFTRVSKESWESRETVTSCREMDVSGWQEVMTSLGVEVVLSDTWKTLLSLWPSESRTSWFSWFSGYWSLHDHLTAVSFVTFESWKPLLTNATCWPWREPSKLETLSDSSSTDLNVVLQRFLVGYFASTNFKRVFYLYFVSSVVKDVTIWMCPAGVAVQQLTSISWIIKILDSNNAALLIGCGHSPGTEAPGTPGGPTIPMNPLSPGGPLCPGLPGSPVSPGRQEQLARLNEIKRGMIDQRIYLDLCVWWQCSEGGLWAPGLPSHPGNREAPVSMNKDTNRKLCRWLKQHQGYKDRTDLRTLLSNQTWETRSSSYPLKPQKWNWLKCETGSRPELAGSFW